MPIAFCAFSEIPSLEAKEFIFLCKLNSKGLGFESHWGKEVMEFVDIDCMIKES